MAYEYDINSIELFGRLLSILALIICFGGFVMNGFLVFAISKNKNLLHAGCCGFFIFILAIIDAFCEFLMVVMQSLPTFLGPMSMLTCFHLEWIPPFLQPNIIILMLTISFDRLWSVTFPIRHKKISMKYRPIYISIVTILPAIGTLYLPYYWYKYAYANKHKIFTCTTTLFMEPFSLFIIAEIQIVANVGMVFNYLLICVMVKCKVLTIAHNTVEQRLHRSLMVLIGVTVLCWLPFPIVNNLLLFYFQLPTNVQNFMIKAGIFPNKVAQAFNPLILYICSTDYRAGMQKELRKILARFGWRQNENSGGNNLAMVQISTSFAPMSNNYVH